MMWADLLRKMVGEERDAEDKDSVKFFDKESIVKRLEQAEILFKQLKGAEKSCALAAKLCRAKADLEAKTLDRQIALTQAQQMAALGATVPVSPAATALYTLPTLQLRQFAGDREKWPEFWEGYKSAIHCRPLGHSEKMNYLRSLLEGEASKIIEGLTLKNENYAVCIKLLREHYGDAETYIRVLYGKLNELRPCKNFEEVKALSIELERISRQLEAAGEKIDDPSVYISLEKKMQSF